MDWSESLKGFMFSTSGLIIKNYLNMNVPSAGVPSSYIEQVWCEVLYVDTIYNSLFTWSHPLRQWNQ